MLSTENLTPNDKGVVAPFPPHVMFYGPYLTNADLGSDGNLAAPVFVAGEGTPQALIIVPLGAHDSAVMAPSIRAPAVHGERRERKSEPVCLPSYHCQHGQSGHSGHDGRPGQQVESHQRPVDRKYCEP